MVKSKEEAHGLGWKIYFVCFIFLRLLNVIVLYHYQYFSKTSYLLIWELVVYLIHFAFTTIVLYSWVWAKQIRWLSKIRWLIKLWSIQFFFAPIALIVHVFIAFKTGNLESIDWIITIVISYPALYAVYHIAWKSTLLYKPEKMIKKAVITNTETKLDIVNGLTSTKTERSINRETVRTKSEGVRRLSFFTGILSSLIFVFFALFSILKTSEDFNLVELGLLVSIAGICFLIGFSLIRAIAWVIDGFRKDRTTAKKRES